MISFITTSKCKKPKKLGKIVKVRERTLSMYEGRPEGFTNFSKKIS